MRLLKQALLAAFMLLASIIIVNLPRLGRSPLEGQAGGQLSIRNGDVDCDGKINITDPLITLNWLFGTGPEPCMAQVEPTACCDSLREEIASLRATVEMIASRVPGPQDIVEFRGEVAFPPQGAELPAITIPQDKWFILTSAQSEAALVRSLNGETVPIRGLQDGPNSSIYEFWSTGHAIPPGSVILLSYPYSYTDPPMPFTRNYYFNGYFLSP
jgi:hypothetical protein